MLRYIFLFYVFSLTISLFFLKKKPQLRFFSSLFIISLVIAASLTFWEWLKPDPIREALGLTPPQSIWEEYFPSILSMGIALLIGTIGFCVSNRRIKKRKVADRSRILNLGKITFVLGTAHLAFLLAGRFWRFFEGMDFMKTWGVLFLIPLLISFLGYAPLALASLISIVRKRTSPKWLVILLFPFLKYYSYYIPIPKFTDGMAYRMNRDFEASYFYAFANEARALPKSETYTWHTDDRLIYLESKFPEIMRIAGTPRLTATSPYVNIEWGSGLVKHWGIRIVNDDQYPFEPSERATVREVFEGVYAYHVPH